MASIFVSGASRRLAARDSILRPASIRAAASGIDDSFSPGSAGPHSRCAKCRALAWPGLAARTRMSPAAARWAIGLADATFLSGTFHSWAIRVTCPSPLPLGHSKSAARSQPFFWMEGIARYRQGVAGRSRHKKTAAPEGGGGSLASRGGNNVNGFMIRAVLRRLQSLATTYSSTA